MPKLLNSTSKYRELPMRYFSGVTSAACMFSRDK
jgi:hypothetical protein